VTAELREHLLASAIAGDVATPRESNVGNIRRLLAGEPYAWLGITPLRDYTFEDLLAIMVARCGIGADPAYAGGADTIDVDLTIAALDAMGRGPSHDDDIALFTLTVAVGACDPVGDTSGR